MPFGNLFIILLIHLWFGSEFCFSVSLAIERRLKNYQKKRNGIKSGIQKMIDDYVLDAVAIQQWHLCHFKMHQKEKEPAINIDLSSCQVSFTWRLLLCACLWVSDTVKCILCPKNHCDIYSMQLMLSKLIERKKKCQNESDDKSTELQHILFTWTFHNIR